MFCSTSNFMYSVKNALDLCMVMSVYLIFDMFFDHNYDYCRCIGPFII